MTDSCPIDATVVRLRIVTRAFYYRDRIAQLRHDAMRYPDNERYKWQLKIAIEVLIAVIACYGDIMNLTFHAARKSLKITAGEIES